MIMCLASICRIYNTKVASGVIYPYIPIDLKADNYVNLA